MAFYDIFEQLCAEKGVTPTQAGRDNGIAQGVVSMWKKRGSTPNALTLVKLAEYFNTTPAYLAGNSMAKSPLINDDEELTEYLEELRTRPEQRMLFSLTKNASKADVEQIVAIVEALQKSNDPPTEGDSEE